MKEEAYKKLLKAISKNELDWFIESRGDYIVLLTGMPGEPHSINYNAMYDALDQYIQDYPLKCEELQDELLEILQTGNANTVRAIIEIVFQRLRYSPNDLGFINEPILNELQEKVKFYQEELNQMKYLNLQQMDYWAYKTSGRHFLLG